MRVKFFHDIVWKNAPFSHDQKKCSAAGSFNRRRVLQHAVGGGGWGTKSGTWVGATDPPFRFPPPPESPPLIDGPEGNYLTPPVIENGWLRGKWFWVGQNWGLIGDCASATKRSTGIHLEAKVKKVVLLNISKSIFGFCRAGFGFEVGQSLILPFKLIFCDSTFCHLKGKYSFNARKCHTWFLVVVCQESRTIFCWSHFTFFWKKTEQLMSKKRIATTQKSRRRRTIWNLVSFPLFFRQVANQCHQLLSSAKRSDFSWHFFWNVALKWNVYRQFSIWSE